MTMRGRLERAELQRRDGQWSTSTEDAEGVDLALAPAALAAGGRCDEDAGFLYRAPAGEGWSEKRGLEALNEARFSQERGWQLSRSERPQPRVAPR